MTLDKEEETVAESPEAPISHDGVARGALPSTRDAIIAAIAEAKQKAEDADAARSSEKPQEKPEEKASDEERTEDSKSAAHQKADKPDEDGAPGEDPGKAGDGEEGAHAEEKKSSEPPAAWSKSGKAQWESLPPSIQEEVLRREANAQKGVEELKSRHREELGAAYARTADLDASIAPYREAIRQAGRTEGQVVDRLFQWHMALSGPQRVEAFRSLAKNFGVDVSTLAGGSQEPSQEPGDADSAAAPAQDMSWVPAFDRVSQRIDQFEAMTAAQQMTAAQKTVDAWSRDKPHFERVRGRMAQMIDMDARLLQEGRPAVNGFIKDDQVDMDAAYEAAVWADPELRSEFLQEQRRKSEEAASAATEQARVESERKLRAEKARLEALQAKRAASSLKPGAPLSGMNGAGPSRAHPRNESVRDSIRRALQER